MVFQELGRRNGRFWKILPWVVTGVLLAYLGVTTDFQTIKESFSKAHKLYLVCMILFFVFLAYFLDTYCLKFLAKRLAPIRYGEMLPIKGASYLLNIVNYNLATGLMAIFLKRSKGVPLYRAFSMMIFLTYIDLIALSVLAFTGLVAGSGEALPRGLAAAAWVFVAGSFASLFIVLLFFRAKVNLSLFNALRGKDIFFFFRTANLKDYLQMLGLRVPFVFQYVLMEYALLRGFDIHIPVVTLLLYVPILTIILIIPVSISGLGTTQIAMRELFSPFVTNAASPQAVIDAFSTTVIFATMTVRVLIGLACLNRAMKKSPGYVNYFV